MSRHRPILSLLCTVGLSLGLTGLGLAQAADAPAEPALKGPEVRDRKVPGVEGKFGEGGIEKNKLQSEQRIPPRVYKDALSVLRSEDAADDVRLSESQSAKLKSIMDEFESSSRAFMQANRDKIAELRKARAGGEGGAGADSRAAYRDLMQQAPKVEDTWTKVWAELSPAQQKAVDARLDEFRSRASEMRQDEYVQKRLNRKLDKPGNGGPGGPGEGRPGPDRRRPDGPGARGLDGPGGPGGPGMGRMDPERHERLMRLLSRMTPEQQDELIRRLEDRVGRGPDQPGRPGPSADRPPRRRPGGPGRSAGEDRPAPPRPPMPGGDSDDGMMSDPMSPPPAPGE